MPEVNFGSSAWKEVFNKEPGSLNDLTWDTWRGCGQAKRNLKGRSWCTQGRGGLLFLSELRLCGKD